MRKFLNKVNRKGTEMMAKGQVAMRLLKDKKGEGYVDSGLKILIAVVVGALLLAGLYALFNNTNYANSSRKS